MTRKQIEKYFVENPSDYQAKKAEYEGCLDGVNLSLKEVVFILSECAKAKEYNETTIQNAHDWYQHFQANATTAATV